MAKFKIVIMHGKSQEYLKVKDLILKLDHRPIILAENFEGKLILEKLQKTVWDKVHCAIVIMSPDDMTKDGGYRARQNVIFELGYCMAAFDSLHEDDWYNAIVIVKENRVDLFSDIEGIEYISYDSTIGKEKLKAIGQAIERVRENAEKFYGKFH